MDWYEPAKLHYARRVAAALGYVALNAANRLYVWPLNASSSAYGPAWGRARAGAMLNFVEEFRPAQASTPVVFGSPANPPDLEQSLATFTNRGGGLVVLLSDLLSPTWEKALTRLGA